MCQKLENTKQSTLLSKLTSTLIDKRRTTKGNHKHKLEDIVLLVITAVLCGADDWDGIEVFGNSQLTWMRKFGSFEHGIPSHDTINRFFSTLDPCQFALNFTSWIDEIRDKIKDEVIAVDGKSIRGSRAKSSGKSAIHMVSAYASKNGLCLGQIKTEEKSNEITAIPELLNLIDVSNCVVSIDAMGCQTNIAQKIRLRDADYLLAVKGNQGSLEQGITDTIRFVKPVDTDTEDDFGHGRIEKRTCSVYTNFEHIEGHEKWVDLRTIVRIESVVTNKKTDITSTQERFYITSMLPDAKRINKAVRSHWSVENNLHWSLDVIFKEDASRKRAGFVAENFNTVAKIALTLLANEKTLKKGKKTKRLNAATNTEYREKLLGF